MEKMMFYQNRYKEIIKIEEIVPNNKEILEVLQTMSPLLREKLVEYFTYYALTLAQEGLKIRDNEKLAFRDWGFTVLAVLKKVLLWLKLKVLTNSK